MTYTGLPDIWSARFANATYNPLSITRQVWLVERWWQRQADAALRASIRDFIKGHHWRDPDWQQIGQVAMNVICRLGSYGALKLSAWAHKHKGRRRPPAELRTVHLADAWDSIAAVDWSMLEGEAWDEFAARVFTPLRDQVFGVATEFVDSYSRDRLPPIANATAELQGRVRDIMANAQTGAWDDDTLEGALLDAGRWPIARVRNQVRTETSTMYNAGRWVHMAQDDAVVAYRAVATIDGRTTPFCRAINGKIIRQGDMQAAPPYHFQCRSILEPLFEWEKPVADDPLDIPVPGEGEFSAAQYEGFGQRELVAQYR